MLAPASTPMDRGGMGILIQGGTCLQPLLLALGVRSPVKQCLIPPPLHPPAVLMPLGLAQSLVICDFGAALAAELQRRF